MLADSRTLIYWILPFNEAYRKKTYHILAIPKICSCSYKFHCDEGPAAPASVPSSGMPASQGLYRGSAMLIKQEEKSL